MKIAIFSIATFSNLSEVKVLLDSVCMHSFSTQTFVFLAEKNQPSRKPLPSDLFGHKVIPIEEVRITPFDELAFQYNREEWMQALKPWAVEYLFHKFDAVIYFDADIEIFASLSQILHDISKYEAIVTPMVTSSIPHDGFFPSYSDMLRAGQLHSGFFCLRQCPRIKDFLKYWKQEIRLGLGTSDPLKNWTGKDVIFSAILSFANDLQIIRSEAYHFSIWNAFQRSLLECEGNLITSDGPLVFLNFQGLERYDEIKLGQHRWVYRSFLPSTKKLRPFLSADLLRNLCKKHQYKKQEVLNRFKSYIHPYTFGYYENGDPIFYDHRKAFLHMNFFEKKMIKNPFL